jgi:hypothetical protein
MSGKNTGVLMLKQALHVVTTVTGGKFVGLM